MTISDKDNVITLKAVMIPDTRENWENGRLGCDERFVKKADPIDEVNLDHALKKGKIIWDD